MAEPQPDRHPTAWQIAQERFELEKQMFEEEQRQYAAEGPDHQAEFRELMIRCGRVAPPPLFSPFM